MTSTSIEPSQPFDFIEWAPEVSQEKRRLYDLEQKSERENERRKEQARQQAHGAHNTEQQNVITAYNENNPIENEMTLMGDISKGRNKFLSRNSQSGIAGVSIIEGKRYSHHDSDSAIGKPAQGGGTIADPFDCYCYRVHGNDLDAALKEAGEQYTIQDPVKGDTVSINKFNQRQYMRQQETTISQHPTTPEPQRLIVSFTSCFDICQEPMRQEFIIDGLIAEGDQVIITGDGGIGKSTIAFHIAHYLAMSREFLFDQFAIPKPRTSLFLNSENSKIQINSRLNNMVGNNPEAREALKRLYAPIIHGDVLTCGKSFDDPKFRQWVVDLVHSIEDYQGSKLDLIWIDPLISFISCDENAAAEMRKNLDGITEVSQMCKITPVVIHHNKKDGGGYRGSSAIRDWTRNLIELNRTFVAQTRLTGDGLSRQVKIPCIHVRHEKCNNFQMFESFTLRMMPDQTFKPIEENLTPEKAEQGEMVKQALTDLGGIANSTNELSKVYQELAGIGHTAAKKHIRTAVDHKFVDRFSMIGKGNQAYKYSLPDNQSVSNRVVT